ncbi:DUF4843 domain-containing protein [Pseudoflavitalea sp. G-6-1-2]|uniref:DUF4843 domain-containing protein n=1 Tax=Pseudoflavitalea sp. G-6-1-2 TaxID=2728841 RepID=UPI00146D9CB6|nr:DUF4843 domain-containing protein [Pseudoflavitalea sp. G-6-1-2]NML23557.1 DUF4843 domain-containing protein [Pseudoflavitalea sp. G-6-1-2]
MKRIIQHIGSSLIILLTGSMFTGCSKNKVVETFNTNKSYIYFAQRNTDNRAVELYIDSLNYSFAMDNPNLDEKTFAIPVKIAGGASQQSRSYTYSIAAQSSNFDASLVSFSEPVIGSGKYTDTLYIRIKKGTALRNNIMWFTLQLKENNDFAIGNKYNEKLRIIFTNQLLEPKWWFTWRNQFGTFYPEIYERWIQIYYLGADPSPDLITAAPGPIYYWNNMPTSAISSWYPVTFMYVNYLKQYFIEHPVYPNGDNTQPRILLP